MQALLPEQHIVPIRQKLFAVQSLVRLFISQGAEEWLMKDNFFQIKKYAINNIFHKANI